MRLIMNKVINGLKVSAFAKLVKKYRECMRANRFLNKQIREMNKFNKRK